jgi:hypothetical protein
MTAAWRYNGTLMSVAARVLGKPGLRLPNTTRSANAEQDAEPFELERFLCMDVTASRFPLLSMENARALIACFFSADVFFVVAYLFLFLYGNPIGSDQPGMFDMDGEANIPAWYSSTKLLAVGLCLYVYGRLTLQKDRLAGWLILAAAALFAYLSLDEAAELHEKFGNRLTLLATGGVGRTDTPFEITGLWMVFFGPPLLLALVGGIVFLRKRLSIPYAVFAKALAGAIIFVLAAGPGDILVNYVTGDAHIVQTAAEELGEMVGATLILWAAMTLLAQQRPMVVGEATAAMPVRAPAPARRRAAAHTDDPSIGGGSGGGGGAAPAPARGYHR